MSVTEVPDIPGESKKSSPLIIIGLNFVKPEPIFKIFFRCWKAQYLQQQPYNIFHHALITLLHYLGS